MLAQVRPRKIGIDLRRRQLPVLRDLGGGLLNFFLGQCARFDDSLALEHFNRGAADARVIHEEDVVNDEIDIAMIGIRAIRENAAGRKDQDLQSEKDELRHGARDEIGRGRLTA